MKDEHSQFVSRLENEHTRAMGDKEKEHADVVKKMADAMKKLLSEHDLERNQWHTERSKLTTDHGREVREWNQKLDDTVKAHEILRANLKAENANTI